jgi:hypothetical protein
VAAAPGSVHAIATAAAPTETATIPARLCIAINPLIEELDIDITGATR